MAEDPVFYDGLGNSEKFRPGDFAGGGHNEIIQAFGQNMERFSNAQFAMLVHGANLFRGYAENEIDLAELPLGSEVHFESTPKRPWIKGGWLRAQAKDDPDKAIQGEILSYDPDSGELVLSADILEGEDKDDPKISEWTLLSQGKRGLSMEWFGEWDQDQEYPRLATVAHHRQSYIANRPTEAGEEPGVSEAWDKIAERGDPGASDFDWKQVASNYDADKDDRLLVQGGVQVNLPSKPQAGYQVTLADPAATWADGVTLDGNGETVEGEDLVKLEVAGGYLTAVYTGDQWVLRYNNGHTDQQDHDRRYRVVVVDGVLAMEEA